MTGQGRYLTSAEFAGRAGIGERAARLALEKCYRGGTWRGHRLVVSRESGFVGRNGTRLFVAHDSLPRELQDDSTGREFKSAASKSSVVVANLPDSPFGTGQDSFSPSGAGGHLSNHKNAGANGDGAAVCASAASLLPACSPATDAAFHVGPTSAPGSALVRPRRPRRDRFKRRTLISRTWDRAVKADISSKEKIRDEIACYVRSLWAQDVRGWRIIQRLALAKLMQLTRASGFAGSDDELKRICILPRGFIDRDRSVGVAIARHDRDAKAFADRLPRIRRDYSQLRPGELIIGDVHPIDIYYRREDGTLATPKGIGWMDACSRYLVIHPVFLAPGEGIRMEHVAASFAAFVRDERIMPARLYLDNGGEYNWAPFAEHAMRLVASPTMTLDGVNDNDTRTIIKALLH